MTVELIFLKKNTNMVSHTKNGVCAYTCMHVCMSVYIYACICAFKCVDMNAYMYVFTYACLYAWIYVCTQTNIYVCMHTDKCTHSCIHACMHTWIPTYIHAYIQIHKFMHTNVLLSFAYRLILYICLYARMRITSVCIRAYSLYICVWGKRHTQRVAHEQWMYCKKELWTWLLRNCICNWRWRHSSWNLLLIWIPPGIYYLW